MGKGLAPLEVPGASAAAEGAGALRVARRRREVATILVALATALALAFLGGGPVWLIAAAGVALGLAWSWRPEPDPGRWLRGARGEAATARLLSRLPRRFVVMHDRCALGGRGNVDHVVIGPSGVWVIDSKVRRARLRIRHGRVLAGNFPIDVAPAARQAARLASTVGVPVRAVVAVHGIGLRRRGKRVEGVAVLPATRVCRRLRRGRRRLTAVEIAALEATVDRLFPPASTAATTR